MGETRILSENSSIRVSLLLLVAGFITGAIWWAASLQSDVKHMRETMDVFVRAQEQREIVKERRDEEQDKRILAMELKLAGKP